LRFSVRALRHSHALAAVTSGPISAPCKTTRDQRPKNREQHCAECRATDSSPTNQPHAASANSSHYASARTAPGRHPRASTPTSQFTENTGNLITSTPTKETTHPLGDRLGPRSDLPIRLVRAYKYQTSEDVPGKPHPDRRRVRAGPRICLGRHVRRQTANIV